MKSGLPPTALNARTGELTPPGMRFCARANSSSDLVISRRLTQRARLYRSGRGARVELAPGRVRASSLAVTLPVEVVKEFKLKKGAEVEVAVHPPHRGRDHPGGLESAAARPQMTFGGEDSIRRSPTKRPRSGIRW